LRTKQERELKVGGVFIEIGLMPSSDLVKNLAALNSIGEIEVNCNNETNVPGLFAAGDVTSVPEKQIVVAAGEGAKAALQAHRYLQRLS
jgi:alkyl hydroperoxide reductase subunit F